MRNKSVSSFVPWLQIGVLIVAAFYIIRLQIDLSIAFRRLELTRAVAAGRTRSDVVQWMGNPDSYKKGIRINGKSTYSLMTYSGIPFGYQRKNGNEDVAILLDENDQIVTAYFESPTDKINLQRRIRSQ